MTCPIRCPTALSLLLAVAAVGELPAQDAPRVVDIRIVGNEVTQPKVILREMALQPGDAAEPHALADSRQAIQDLGLFREVEIEQEPAEGGVVLVVRVRERRYLLPIPRGDANSDGDYSYGAQLRWANVFGLNHRLTAYVEEAKFRSERDREQERSARLTYTAPYVFDTPYGLRFFVDRSEQVTLDRQENSFDETFHRVELLGLRDFTEGRPRHGWTLGAGLSWQDQKAEGVFAPASDGSATALVGIARYTNLRDHIYSDTGQVFDARAEWAKDGWASDYGYERLQAEYRDYRAIGARTHQTLHFIAGGGVVTGGPRSRNNFSLGGSTRLRGYDSDYVEGDTYWYVAGEFLRPLRWDWLRLLAIAEIGGARRNVFGERNRRFYADIGLGLRARFTWFVDIELEIGVALPLVDGDGLRFFASEI